MEWTKRRLARRGQGSRPIIPRHRRLRNAAQGWSRSDAASGQSYETGRYNRIVSDDTYDYEYDAEGNRTKRTHSTSGDYTEYEWDHRNRLVKITDKSVSNVTQQVVDQVYDTYNRWISRAVDTSSPFDMGDAAVTDFVHDGNQVLLRLDDGELTHRYLWGQAVDQLLADEQYDTGDTSHDEPATETGKVLWPLADHLGTIRHHAEYDAGEDETNIVNTLTYDTYGNITAETGSTDLLFGFTGRAFDEATGLQYNLNRWYDGSVGVWVSEDPIGFAAGDTNLARFVANIPSTFVDPSGLKIYLAKGRAGTWDPVGVIHQDVAVDTWKQDECGCWVRTGRVAFSFGVTGEKRDFGEQDNWLGWSDFAAIGVAKLKLANRRMKAGRFMEGWIYDSTADFEPKWIFSTLDTTPEQDIEWRKYMEKRLRTKDRYTVLWNNCVNYTNHEFGAAKKRFGF